MPFYDLRCTSCKKEFNIMASMSDRTDKRIACPECGSRDMEALFKGAPNYIVKGRATECPNRHVCGSGCCHSNG